VLGVPKDQRWRKRGWPGPRRPSPAMNALIATFLLSGGRESEVLGLEVGDVYFERTS
jgi:hypothetical protein